MLAGREHVRSKGGRMPDLEQSNNKRSDFLTEKIKIKPVNKRKLIRRTLITAVMAVIFGLIACVTFLVLEPVISNWLYPEEEPQFVTFPEDQEEMLPEDMLAENLPEESPEPDRDQDEESIELGEAQIQEILSHMKPDISDYREMQRVLAAYADNLRIYMVTVTAVTSNRDWFDDIQESKNQCSGLILENNGKELLILTNYSTIRKAERLILTFYGGEQVEAQLKQQDSSTGLAVVSVELSDLPYEMEEDNLPIAALGSSNSRNLPGTPVVAMGSPMGISGSVGYGIVTASGSSLSLTDRNYNLLLTDIVGSKSASGVLFNLQGQVIGIITDKGTVSDMDNMICAYGITELKKIIENMSNGIKTPYLGISGVDVPAEANREQGVPYGAYVREVDFDSPARRAGIQRGDVIIGVEGKTVSTFNSYSNSLLQLEAGHTIELKVMRWGRSEYREMNFSIVLGEVKSED